MSKTCIPGILVILQTLDFEIQRGLFLGGQALSQNHLQEKKLHSLGAHELMHSLGHGIQSWRCENIVRPLNFIFTPVAPAF